MPDEKTQLLGKLLDALFAAEFGAPQCKAQNESAFEGLLEQAGHMSGKSTALIKEAILKDRYPQYRKNRLASELPSVPPKARRQ